MEVAGDTEPAPRQESCVDAETAREHIRERGVCLRERELERALDRLRERRDLCDSEERAVRTLATDLTDGLLAVPEAHLRAIERVGTDDGCARVVLELFGEPEDDTTVR